jgi:hypothetical protein
MHVADVNALNKLVERLRQNDTASRRDLDRETPKPACSESRLGCTFLAGDRVFDRESGQHGVVIAGTIESYIVPAPKRQDG